MWQTAHVMAYGGWQVASGAAFADGAGAASVSHKLMQWPGARVELDENANASIVLRMRATCACRRATYAQKNTCLVPKRK